MEKHPISRIGYPLFVLMISSIYTIFFILGCSSPSSDKGNSGLKKPANSESNISQNNSKQITEASPIIKDKLEYKNEPDEFRGIKWGAHLDQTDRMIYVRDDDTLPGLKRRNPQYALGEVP